MVRNLGGQTFLQAEDLESDDRSTTDTGELQDDRDIVKPEFIALSEVLCAKCRQEAINWHSSTQRHSRTCEPDADEPEEHDEGSNSKVPQTQTNNATPEANRQGPSTSKENRKQEAPAIIKKSSDDNGRGAKGKRDHLPQSDDDSPAPSRKKVKRDPYVRPASQKKTLSKRKAQQKTGRLAYQFPTRLFKKLMKEYTSKPKKSASKKRSKSTKY